MILSQELHGTQHSIQIHRLQRHAIISGIFPDFKYALQYDQVFIQALKQKQKLKLKWKLRTDSISSIHVSVQALNVSLEEENCSFE